MTSCKIVLASRSIPGACSASVASSLLVESMLDAVVGAGLIAWAVRSGALPLDRLTPAAIDGRMLALRRGAGMRPRWRWPPPSALAAVGGGR